MDKLIPLLMGALIAVVASLGSTKQMGATNHVPIAAAPSAVVSSQDGAAQVKTITIKAGNFFFEGPEGKSGSESKTPTDVKPQVVAKLKNGEKVKLVFVNVGGIDHEVISPLFSAPEEKRFPLGPDQNLEIELTPKFLTPEDGGTVVFDLWCHVRHSQSTDHYRLGMRALIEIVP
jgi:hypothetical protein